MDTLQSLLVQNQNNLDRLRVRSRYARSLLSGAAYDSRRQFGPYADFWDEWYDQARSLADDLCSDVRATEEFVAELRQFTTGTVVTHSPSSVSAADEMIAFAKEAVACQKDMLHMADTRITEHREFTQKLLLVEAIDSLNEE